MTLPKDGIPRITIHGIKLLEQGLEGNFDGWYDRGYSNHPMELPEEDVQNCQVIVSKDWYGDAPQFIVEVWFGKKFPRVRAEGMATVPCIEFDMMEFPDIRKDLRYEVNDHILLRCKKDWFARTILWIEDKQVWTPNLEEDEDDDGMVDVDIGCVVEKSKTAQTGLEAFL